MDHAKQLRAFAERCFATETERAGLRAAADEIERLLAEVERQRADNIISARAILEK